jgi:hypothetical protein
MSSVSCCRMWLCWSLRTEPLLTLLSRFVVACLFSCSHHRVYFVCVAPRSDQAIPSISIGAAPLVCEWVADSILLERTPTKFVELTNIAVDEEVNACPFLC